MSGVPEDVRVLAVEISRITGASLTWAKALAADLTPFLADRAARSGEPVVVVKVLEWSKPVYKPATTVTGDRGGVHTTANSIVGRYDIHRFDGGK